MVELGDARVLAPGRWRWARALGWMVGLFVALFLLFTFSLAGVLWPLGFRPTPEGDFVGGDPWIKVAATAFSLALTVAAYLFAVRFGENRTASEFALRRAVPEWLGGTLVGALLMTVAVSVMALLGFVAVADAPLRSIADAIALTLQSGIFEEVVFRLVVFRLLWRAFGPWWAMALSALIFGLIHLSNPNATVFAGIAIAFEAGILLAAFYMLTGRIWMSIGMHMGWNFTQGWVLGAAVSGTGGFAGGPMTTTPRPQVADWLDGGAFGPEAALPALVICTGAGLFVLHRAWRRDRFGQA